MKDLIIAEKPSVGRDLADVLMDGSFEKKDGYFEDESLVITWSVGHLLSLSYPQKYPGWVKTWKKEQLPMLPDQFLINPIGDKRNKDQLKTIKKLFDRSDIKTIINACDAGREGELIFSYIYQHSGSTKPVERIWLQSMTKSAIKDAYKNREPAENYKGLEAAARSRSEADWIFGINGTQAATLALSPLKLEVISIGRVQTPTLAILQAREKEISAFVPAPYSVVEGEFKTKKGDTYKGKIAEEFDKKTALKIANECQGKDGVVANLKKTKKNVVPPLLFDLTSLQREAGSLYGFTAKRTLAIAQRLYEHHKIISYPRTSSRFLPSDMESDVLQSMKAASDSDTAKCFTPSSVKAANFPRVFDDSKVSDHFAIIPTDKQPGKLDDSELKLYDLIRRRFFAAFMDDAVAETTRFETKVEKYTFKTSGKRYISLGWGAIEPGRDEKIVPALSEKEKVESMKIESIDLETKPPKRYSDSSLLSAMETAGRDLEDEELRELMKDAGLGTPATRAAIIERLIDVGYLERVSGRSLKVTDKGVLVIDLLSQLEEKMIVSPELTGSWEKKLLEIEKNDDLRDSFIKDIEKRAERLVSDLFKIKLSEDLIEKSAVPSELGPCPFCKKPVRENRRAFSCWSKDDPGCGFSIWKKVAGKNLPREAIIDLYQNQKTSTPVEGFRSKKGRTFKANLKLEIKDKKTTISFDEEWASRPEESSAPEEAS